MPYEDAKRQREEEATVAIRRVRRKTKRIIISIFGAIVIVLIAYDLLKWYSHG